MSHSLAGGVAVRVSALCLDARGRPARVLICSAAVRAGLLLDLALAGRITETADAVEIDATPTGFGPADRLLAAVGAERERSLDSWLDERRLGLRDLVEANEASGRWVRQTTGWRRTCYVDRAEERTRSDLLRTPDTDPSQLPPEDACVTAVAAAAGLLARETGAPADVPATLVTSTGEARWLAEYVAPHLTATYWRHRSQAIGLRAADTIGPG
jgi:hypothetical protein